MTTWIKCSDRLPEEGVYVLVYNDADELRYHVASHQDGYWVDDEYAYANVTHWSELPDPPKEDA